MKVLWLATWARIWGRRRGVRTGDIYRRRPIWGRRICLAGRGKRPRRNWLPVGFFHRVWGMWNIAEGRPAACADSTPPNPIWIPQFFILNNLISFKIEISFKMIWHRNFQFKKIQFNSKFNFNLKRQANYCKKLQISPKKIFSCSWDRTQVLPHEKK